MSKPVTLDAHRGMSAQKETEIRRRLKEIEVDQRALRRRQAEFESYLAAEPAANWMELAERARYLILLFGNTLEAQDGRRKILIASVLSDLQRLVDEADQGLEPTST